MRYSTTKGSRVEYILGYSAAKRSIVLKDVEYILGYPTAKGGRV